MNFKNIQIILATIAFSKSVLSSPISDIQESNGIIDDIKYIKEDIADEIKGLFTDDISGKALKESNNDVCSTSECADTSSKILSKMNSNIDPCEDFYQFTCGKFLEETLIPDDKAIINSFSTLADENINILRTIIESDYKENKNLTAEQQELDRKMFGKLKTVYNTCMDVNTIKSKGKEPLIKLFEQLEIQKNKDSYKTVDGLTDLLNKLSSIATDIFVSVGVDSDLKNPEKNTIIIKQSPLTLFTKEYYNNNDITSQYQEVIKNMFINIFGDEKDSGNFFTNLFHDIFGGSDGDNRDFDKISKSIVELEKKLINIAPDQELMYDSSLFVESDVKSMNGKYPYINWNSLLRKMFPSADINDNSPVTFRASSYFDGLANIINETDDDTILAFAEWTIIKAYSNYLSDDIKQPLNVIISALAGTTKEQERSTYCINIVNPINSLTYIDVVGESMSMAFGKYFVEEVFSPESKHSAEDLIKNIKDSMKKRIPQMSWIDKQTAEEALKKVNEMVDKIGYPEYIMNPEKLDEEFKNLEIVNDDFFTNVLNIARFTVEKNLLDVYKPKDKSKYHMPPSIVNAMFNPVENDITFPAGILRSPFFSLNNPDYLNYGAIGGVIGHEMTHSFDNNGKDYDSRGALRNWWTNSTAEEFDKLAQCFIDQYGSYTIQDSTGKQINLNGKLTLGENLADNGGLARSYEAYKANGKNNQALPGLTQYTNDQLFYISFGQIWCSKERPEILATTVYADPHSPARYRVNGVVSNSQYFAEAFKCKTGSPMNPEKKCLIW